MLRATLKSLLGHKLRLLATSLAVVLGIAFMAGTFVLTDTMRRTFDDLFRDVSAEVDVVVRSTDEIDVPFGGSQRSRIDLALLDVVRDVDGVAGAEGEIQGYAQFVDADGEPIGNPGMGAPTFAVNWPDLDEINPMNLVEGRAPEADDEIVADKGTTDRGDLSVGDTVTVLTSGASTEFELVGIARFGSVDSPGGASVGLMTFDAAQRLLIGGREELTQISVVGESGRSQQELAGAIEAALPADADAEAITGEAYIEENQDAIGEGLSFFTTALLVFAAIALFVSCFIIYNTFGIIVAQRTQELALLRAIGATRRQVLGSVLGEAAAVGLVASLGGLVAGIALASGMKALLGAIGFDIPATGLLVLPRTVVASIVVGMAVTMLSALFPARRAGRIPPIAAMRDVAVDRSARSRRRLIGGAILLTLGIALLVSGLSSDSGDGILTAGIAVGVIFIAVAVLSPLLARPVTAALGWPIARLRGMPGSLARDNAIRNPARTATTGAALMIGVGLVSFIAIFAESTKAAVIDLVDDTMLGDFVVATESGFGQGGLPAEVTAQIGELDGVDLAAGLRLGIAEVDGSAQFLAGIDPAAGVELFDIGIVGGDPLAMDADGLAAHDEFAADRGWELGTTVPVHFTDLGTRELTVQLLYTEEQLAGNVFLPQSGFEVGFPDQADAQVIVRTDDGADLAEVRSGIEGLIEPFPTAQLQDLEEFKDAQVAQIQMLVNVIYALLLLAVVIALVGIANTLALSVFERTREIGLLRAVGMTRAQVRTTVRWEAVLIALFGTALGLVLGLFFGWALVQALESEGFNTFAVPVTQLVVIAVVAAVAGVLAAVFPARRAARLDILGAIATE